jgi:endonuclease YncB( thermonuclease family)
VLAEYAGFTLWLVRAVQMRRSLLLILTVVGLGVALAQPTRAGEVLVGRVVQVTDGDTFLLRTATGAEIWVRVAEIDAPEGDQPFGDQSRRALAALIAGRMVQVAVKELDAYGRTVGRPFTADRDICAQMVADGAAWAYRRYLTDATLLDAEAQARLYQRGLWGASTEPVPPWEWRHRLPQRSSEFAGQPTRNAADATCDIKGNISSAGERIYHVRGQRYYTATKIDAARGERWFCSESDARKAGWRRSNL